MHALYFSRDRDYTEITILKETQRALMAVNLGNHRI